MDIILAYVIVPLVGLVIGWFGRKWLTPREAKKEDLDIINQSVTPLLESQIKILEQNASLIAKLSAKEEANLVTKQENMELRAQVSELSSKIKELENKIDRLIVKVDLKEESIHEKK